MAVLPYDSSRDALYTPERDSTLLQMGMAVPALGLCAELSRMAYLRAESDSKDRARLLDVILRAGLTDLQLFSSHLTGAFGWGARQSDGQGAFLVFRGTQPDDAGDIGTDLTVVPTPWAHGPGCVHTGFALAFESIRAEVLDWCHRLPTPVRLHVTGHSLGGAMATLLASEVPVEALATFGSPHVGNRVFLDGLKAVQVHRVVNCCDIVARLPPPELFGYAPMGPVTDINRDAQCHVAPTVEAMLADQHTARQAYLTEHAWKLGAVLLRDLADHAPFNYVRAFY